MPRSLDQWIDYIQTLHARTIDLGLARVATVWERMKPNLLPVVITVAGTNGKGSSVSMLESVYRQAGYKTGAFTSPHLVKFNERICINNQSVSDALLLASFEKIETIRGDVTLTFFEFNVLLALDIFSQSELEIVLLEVGLGGRLDATNIIDNDLALITAIGIDHTAWLGNDRETIAVEKAGIIKHGGMAVIADPDAPTALAQIAAKQSTKCVHANKDYQLKKELNQGAIFSSSHSQLKCFDGVNIESTHQHIQNNTAGVISAIAMLKHKLPVSTAALERGIRQQTIIARLQIIDRQPPILLDVSHNEDSILAMIEFIDSMDIKGDIHAVYGALADKQYHHAFAQLKLRVNYWYLVTLLGERGQTATSLKQNMFEPSQGDQSVALFDTPQQAYLQGVKAAHPQDVIVIFGSFHLVGAIIPILAI